MSGRDPDLKKFGLIVRKLRERKGLTQEALSEQTGLDRTYISGIEVGRRNVGFRNIVKIIKALGVTSAVFFKKFEL